MVMIRSMRELNIAGIDLNLVPALEALLRRRSVTRAAADVGLSQPAMSRAFARLRELQNDPLMLRTPAGYVLTPRAEAIQPLLADAVVRLRDLFTPQLFDPASERRTLRIAASDSQTVTLLPRIATRLAVDAPGVDLRVEAYSPDLVARIESGALDLAFALSTTPLPPGAHSEAVAEDCLALVMRRDHPAAARRWSAQDYGRFDHVGITLLGDGQSEIDALLAEAGVNRRIAVQTPHFMAALAIVASTDLVTTLSATLAHQFASTFGLAIQPPPFGERPFKLTLVGSHIRAADPFLAWFRQLVREAAAELLPHRGA